MDFNTDIRRVQLESLEQFILSSKDKVRNVLEVLNWEDEKVLKDKKLVACVLDPTHKIPQKSASNHVKKCAIRKEGYNLVEEFLSEPQHHSETSIMIDNQKKIEILSLAHKTRDNFVTRWNGQDPDPRTSDRLLTTYSYDERLALYDYAIANTKEPNKLPEYNVSQPKRDESKPMTYEEQLALERDAKRRRIKYKSVHTSRKTHTEVLREVIESQMEVYRDWIGARSSKKDDGEHEGRSTSRNSSNSSRSTLRKDLKQKESSDTESVDRESCKSRRGTPERNNKKRERSKESIRSYREKSNHENVQDEIRKKDERNSRNEGFGRRSESERRRYKDDEKDVKYWDKSKYSRRNESKDYRNRERRNGYKNYF
ncbi:U11/U12 small nuclear ribonucleoprotein 48 kDa protein-like [Onthophagus taurus]|uniref:U11/U12 small nuclear ribonucleoprotein 48 kDa protein-like n=1 Tax=Onthophagus taurus TaxID=166361 RepID=UPI000C207C55|nr:uncharacterized protein LOC111416939 isoform X1 [Onthophagus taurus]